MPKYSIVPNKASIDFALFFKGTSRYHTWPDLYQPNEVVVFDQLIDDKNQITEVEDAYLFFVYSMLLKHCLINIAVEIFEFFLLTHFFIDEIKLFHFIFNPFPFNTPVLF